MGNLLTRLALLCALTHTASIAIGQCANDNTAIAGGAITPNCPGTTNVPCVQGGQYALVNVTAGYQYTFATCGAAFDTQITLYNNAGGASLGYNDDSGTCGFLSSQSYIAWTAGFTGQLRVLVDRYNCANHAVCAPLTITCSIPPPPVTNGNPCGALAQSLVSACGGGTFTNAGGGNSGIAAPTCGSYLGGSQDVWFSFVAGPLGQVNLLSSAGTLTDGVMAVYSAPSCSGPFTQIACDDDSGPGLMPQLGLNGLVPGQAYFVRFWGYGTATGSFNLCVQGVSTVPPGGCVYMLNLFDSFGDGWGSSSVGVSINGGPFTYYTVTGSTNNVAIPATPGTLLVLTYVNTGPWQGENSYTLTLGAGSIFNSGSPPAAGNSFAATLTCNPPPAPPEDCVGSVTICNGQSFNNNTNNTGNVADLTLATAGCLLNTERQGTWYNFTISASGQVAFTINPANPADDYDFAIWGPFPPGSTPSSICPPLSAPLRCSYAAPGGATGLNYTATDLSEDAFGDKWVRYLDVVVGQVYLLYISNWSQSGLAFNLDWNLQGGASLDCTVLGAELVSLKAHDRVSEVLLEWTIANSGTYARYAVERAATGGAFIEIGALPGLSGTGASQEYRFLDRSPLDGMNWYRIRMHEASGESRLSHEIAVLHDHGARLFRLSPNPMDASGWIEFSSEQEGVAVLDAFTPDGRHLQSWSMPVAAGTNRQVIDTRRLLEGAYPLRLQLPGGGVRHARLTISR